MTKPSRMPLTAVPSAVAAADGVAPEEGEDQRLHLEISTLRRRERARELLARERAEEMMTRAVSNAVTGIEFLYSAPEPDPVWGRGGRRFCGLPENH
jgi:hypothetical protein